MDAPNAAAVEHNRRPHPGDTRQDGRVQVLLLDVGGVLEPLADPAAMEAVERELALQAGGLRALLYECEAWHALSTGRLDEAGYWRLVAAQAGHDPAGLQSLLQPAWESTTARLDADVVALARAARDHVRVAILSNNTLRLEERLEACGVAELFDPIINSARVGLRKPDPRIFEHALEVLGVPAQAVLFVDDKVRNTRIAEELGMLTVCFDAAATLRAAMAYHGILPAEAR